MRLLDSPIAWLNRPYFNLASFNEGPPHLYGIEFCYRNLVGDNPMPYGVQVNFSSRFRKSLIEQTGMIQYQVDNPLQLAKELRTERWEKLCDYLTHYQELKPVTKLRVINLLKSLCLHHSVLEYVPHFSDAEIASQPDIAALAWCRAISNLILKIDFGRLDSLKEIEAIAINAPFGTRLKFSAAIQLVVYYAKTFKDVVKAEYWRSFATKEIQTLKPIIDDFDYKLLMSIYYRAVSFVPLLHQDKQKVIEEMDLCQFYGESLTYKNEVQQINGCIPTNYPQATLLSLIFYCC